MKMRRTRELRECGMGCSGLEGENVLRRVKILGPTSLNRRRYLPEAMQQAAPMYEGVRVNLDHPDRDPAATRSVLDRIGVLRNVTCEASGLFGDLLFNPKHAFAETLRWWAENQPDAVGLSHNSVGQGRDDNGVFVVEKIVSVRSVDLVADSASTAGLFESIGHGRRTPRPSGRVKVPGMGTVSRNCYERVLEQVRAERRKPQVMTQGRFRNLLLGKESAQQRLRESVMGGDSVQTNDDVRGEVASAIAALVRKTDLSGEDLRKKVNKLLDIIDDTGGEAVESIGRRGRSSMSRAAFRKALRS